MRVAAIVAETARQTQEAAERKAAWETEKAIRREQAAERHAAFEDWSAAQAAERKKSTVERATDRAHAAVGDVELTAEQVAAIHAAIRHIAGFDADWARERNDAGFSQSDTTAGHWLADLEVLGSREAVLGRVLVSRYRRQVPYEMLAVALRTTVAMQEPVVVVEHVAELAVADIVVEAAVPQMRTAEPGQGTAPTMNMLSMLLAARDPDAVHAPVELPTYPEMSQASITAVHACLGLLAGSDHDLGRDSLFIRSPRRREMPTAAQAWLCRQLVDRHRELLPSDLVGVAMGEIESLPEPAPANVLETEQAVTPVAVRKRPVGAPPKNAVAMTAAERQRAWRAAHKTKALEVSVDSAERLRLAREARGISMDQLSTMALQPLEREADRDRISA